MGALVTRFAPSPTGCLHLGHAASALLAWGCAREGGGRFLLRLEDIDAGRCRAAFAESIIQDLTWLGLDWESPVRVQSAHMTDYARCLDTLRTKGVVYRCFCSRADLAAALGAPQGDDIRVYPGICRDLSARDVAARVEAGAAYGWRLDLARARGLIAQSGAGRALGWHEVGVGWVEAMPEQLGDVMVGRKDAPVSYFLAATHDDAVQDISLVVRGEDLRAATGVQVVLQTLLGWNTPDYRHHPLLRDETGRRLAKRDRAAGLSVLRAEGYSPDDVRNLLPDWYGAITINKVRGNK